MITLLRLELFKLFRSRSFYLSFAALFGFVLLMLWGFYSYAQRKTSGLAAEQFKYTYESKSYFNGLTFTLYSLVFAFSLLIPIFVAMTAGGQIAGERRAGTLSLVDDPGRIFRDDALWRFFFASFSGTWALLVVAALATLLSVIFENPVTAVASTLAIYLMLYIVGRIEFFVTLRPFFFTTDIDFWRDVLKPEIPWPSFYHYATTCGAYIFGLLLLAVVIFERRDITS